MVPEDFYKELRVERKLDKESGVVEVRYFWKDREVRKVKLEGAIAERHAGLTLIQKDLTNALKWAKKATSLLEQLKDENGETFQQIKDRELGDEVKALFIASLTFYGKAFTEAGGRRAQLSRDSLDLEFRDRHDYFMKFRHNLAAHSGDEKLENAESYLLLVSNNRNFDIRLAANRSQPDFAMPEDGEEQLTTLIEHVIAKVNEQHHKIGKRIILAAAKKDREFWMRVSKLKPFNIDDLIKEVG